MIKHIPCIPYYIISTIIHENITNSCRHMRPVFIVLELTLLTPIEIIKKTTKPPGKFKSYATFLPPPLGGKWKRKIGQYLRKTLYFVGLSLLISLWILVIIELLDARNQIKGTVLSDLFPSFSKNPYSWAPF